MICVNQPSFCRDSRTSAQPDKFYGLKKVFLLFIQKDLLYQHFLSYLSLYRLTGNCNRLHR